MPDVSELLADLDDEYAETRSLVAGLARDDARWDRPTPAAGWAVRDQISHLAFFDDAGRRAVEDPEDFAREAEVAMAQPGDPMETHLKRGRSMTGDQLLAWWDEAHAGLTRALSGADPGLRLPWYGPPMGVLSFVSARLMETWAHGQDVADALGIEHRGSDRLRHVAHLGVRARPFSYAVRGREVPPGRIDVGLVGPSGASWEWQVGEPAAGQERIEDRAVESEPPPPRSASRVLGAALDFCLVVTQRRNVADTALVIEGEDAAEWMSLAQAFAGPPGPGRPAWQADERAGM
jgi:uncharacterized protein (TIGR03084 family)